MSRSQKLTKEEKRLTRQNSMMNDSVSRLILKMAFPTILSFLITSIYNLADTFFVSFIGTDATAAVSVNQSLDMIIMMGGSMLAVGAASYVSRLLGAGNKDRADLTLSTAFFTAVIFGTVILVFGKLFITPLVNLLGATDSCRQYSIDYADYVLYAAPIMAGSFVLNQCLRAEGLPLFSMIGMGFGGVLNCVLDPIFILDGFDIFGIHIEGLGMGVMGASLATAISKLISFLILIIPYILKTCNLTLSLRKIAYEKDIIREVVTVGGASLLRNAMSIVSGIVLNNIAGRISVSLLAAIGVSNKVMMFPFGFVLGFGNGYQPVAGFSWGAKNYERVRKSYRFAAKTGLIGSAVMGGLIALFAENLIGLFTSGDTEMIRLGALCIRLQSLALPIHAWVAIVNMLCAGLGDGGRSTILAVARQGICFLPIVFPLAMAFGEYGVCAVQAVADGLTILLAIPIIRRMLWKIDMAEQEHKREMEALAGGEA